MRTKVRTRLLKFTMAMEIVMAITILGAILASIALLICGSVEKFCCQWESFSIDAFMANAFLIVMGIEFVKMLMLHTYGAVIDVLLFAIARQMIISHEEPMQTLMSGGRDLCHQEISLHRGAVGVRTEGPAMQQVKNRRLWEETQSRRPFFFRDHFRFRSGQKRMKTRAHTAIR